MEADAPSPLLMQSWCPFRPNADTVPSHKGVRQRRPGALLEWVSWRRRWSGASRRVRSVACRAPSSSSLRRLRRAERERAVRAAAAADAGACDLATGDEALAVIEAAEQVKAWADSVALAATRRVVEVLDEEDRRHAAPRIGAAARLSWPTPWSRRLLRPLGPGRTRGRTPGRPGHRGPGPGRAAAGGDADPRGEPVRAITVHEATTGIETEDLPEVHAAVLADRRDGTRPHRPRSATGSPPRSSATTPTPANAPVPGVCATAPPGSAGSGRHRHLTVTGDDRSLHRRLRPGRSDRRALKAAGHGTPLTPTHRPATTATRTSGRWPSCAPT